MAKEDESRWMRKLSLSIADGTDVCRVMAMAVALGAGRQRD